MSIKIDIRSIFVQLLVLLLIVSVVPVAILAYMNSVSVTDSKNLQFEEKIGESSSMAIRAIGEQAVNDGLITDKIASDIKVVSALKTGDEAALKALVGQYGAEHKQFRIITITNNNSVVMARLTSDKNGEVTNDVAVRNALDNVRSNGYDILPASEIAENNLGESVKASNTTDGFGIISCYPVKDEKDVIIGSVYTCDLLNNNNDFTDDIAGEMNGYCTIFQQDTRVATNLKDANNKRIIGTKASPVVVSKVITGGEAYQDKLTVNGIPMYVHYEPLKSPTGKVVGMLFVGTDMRPGLAEINNMNMMAVGLGAVLAILSLGVGFVIVSRITGPINRLVLAADGVAAGNLDTQVDTGAKGGEVGRLTDATKKMVANIKDRIQYNESVLKGISYPMYAVNRETEITFFNKDAEKLTGYTAGEATGKKYQDIFGRQENGSNIDKCLRTGEIIRNFETTIATGKGNTVLVRGTCAPLKDARGTVTGAITLLQDITSEKEAEASIKGAQAEAQEKAAYSDSILKSIKDMHIVIDIQGRITYMNDSGQKTIGIPGKEAMGKTIMDITKLKNCSGKVVQALKTGSDLVNVEDEILLRNSMWLPVVVNSTIIKDGHGSMTGMSIIARDITSEREAKENLRAIIAKTNEIAERVAKAAEQATDATGQAMVSSRQISESITQIAGGSQSQARDVEHISSLIKTISTDAADVSGGAISASTKLKEANEAAKQVDGAAKQAMGKMTDIKASVAGSAEIVRDLGEKSKQIGKIVDVINSIASQTNLLALNAAIEAARAGEAGRGFAVVAEEVRKLAEDSAKSTSQISTLISQIKEQTDQAVVSMDKGTEEVAIGSEVVAKALKSVEEISRLVDEVANVAMNVSTAAEKQVSGTMEIAKAIEQISAVVEESAASTEEVSASAEEGTSTMEETANIAQQVLKMAEELKTEVNKLKVD